MWVEKTNHVTGSCPLRESCVHFSHTLYLRIDFAPSAWGLFSSQVWLKERWQLWRLLWEPGSWSGSESSR